MIGRVRELGLPFSRLTADEADGDHGKLREWLGEQQISYVPAEACVTLVPAGTRVTTGPIRWKHAAWYPARHPCASRQRLVPSLRPLPGRLASRSTTVTTARSERGGPPADNGQARTRATVTASSRS
jgi:hypothetical protein